MYNKHDMLIITVIESKIKYLLPLHSYILWLVTMSLVAIHICSARSWSIQHIECLRLDVFHTPFHFHFFGGYFFNRRHWAFRRRHWAFRRWWRAVRRTWGPTVRGARGLTERRTWLAVHLRPGHHDNHRHTECCNCWSHFQEFL